jgi:hypothetical protein
MLLFGRWIKSINQSPHKEDMCSYVTTWKKDMFWWDYQRPSVTLHWWLFRMTSTAAEAVLRISEVSLFPLRWCRFPTRGRWSARSAAAVLLPVTFAGRFCSSRACTATCTLPRSNVNEFGSIAKNWRLSYVLLSGAEMRYALFWHVTRVIPIDVYLP